MFSVTLLVLATSVLETTGKITYLQPERSIKCPPDVNEICYIELTISNVQTLTAYCPGHNGTRGDRATGYQVTVNEEGGFDFVYPQDVANAMPCNATETGLFQPIVADGTTRRNLLVVNYQLPGPTIIGYKNQRVRINVTNILGTEAITLHWHGQHVNGSSGSQNQYSDGVPFVTQCPILPGASFVYDFRFYPAGTYWYHSHQFNERSDGIYGGLVVLDSPQPNSGYVDIPEEHTIVFSEYFPVNSIDWINPPHALPDLANPLISYSKVPTNDGTAAGDPPFFAGLMNFVGWRYNPSVSNCTRVANNPLPFFNVSQGTSYRFRLIGSQSDYAYRFSIAGHRLRVIASDGIDAIVPSSRTNAVDFIIVHTGERYDFVLEAIQRTNNYLMLIETLEVPSMLTERGYCIKAHRGYAVLHYNGASDELPTDFDESYDPLTRCTTTTNHCHALNCPFKAYPSNLNIVCISVLELEQTNREPVPNNDVSTTAFLNFGFSRGPSINDRILEYPQSPPLSQLEDIPPNLFCEYSVLQQVVTPNVGPQSGNTTVVPADTVKPQPPFTCVHTYNVTTDTVEMVFASLGTPQTTQRGTAHPIHLHGHHYFVMDIGYPTYFANGTVNSSNTAINCSADGGNCNIGANWTNGVPPQSPCEATNTCPLKDTVIVPVGGYVRIRFPRNNWGWWILHCHIDPHLLRGMAMLVNETSVPGDFPVPNGFPKCANFDNTPQDPVTEVPSPTVNPEELHTYRAATIALAVIAVLLLSLLIVVVITKIASRSPKDKNKPTILVEEMK